MLGWGSSMSISFDFPHPEFLVATLVFAGTTLGWRLLWRRWPRPSLAAIGLAVSGGLTVGAYVAAHSGWPTGLLTAATLAVFIWVAERARARV
jgi:hypothetical protein